MKKTQKPVYYGYVADMEAKYGDGRSNRTLIEELSGKERASERLLYKEVARIVSSLYEQWDRERHAALDKDERKTVHFEPVLIVYPDGSKKFSCTVFITHVDFSLLVADLPTSLSLQEQKHPFTALSLKEFSHTLASAYDLTLPYVKAGYQPKMYSVRTVMPEIHFPGYCPSPIPEYVMSQKKFYREPPITTFGREFVKERLVEVKPWYPLPDEPEFMLVTYELTDGYPLYDLRGCVESGLRSLDKGTDQKTVHILSSPSLRGSRRPFHTASQDDLFRFSTDCGPKTGKGTCGGICRRET